MKSILIKVFIYGEKIAEFVMATNTPEDDIKEVVYEKLYEKGIDVDDENAPKVEWSYEKSEYIV